MKILENGSSSDNLILAAHLSYQSIVSKGDTHRDRQIERKCMVILNQLFPEGGPKATLFTNKAFEL